MRERVVLLNQFGSSSPRSPAGNLACAGTVGGGQTLILRSKGDARSPLIASSYVYKVFTAAVALGGTGGGAATSVVSPSRTPPLSRAAPGLCVAPWSRRALVPSPTSTPAAPSPRLVPGAGSSPRATALSLLHQSEFFRISNGMICSRLPEGDC
ncbi:hypothetical protein ACJJTC_007678 [Scirpophaga incertulas]